MSENTRVSCSNCEFPTNDLLQIQRTYGERNGQAWYLCKICRQTYAGNAYEFPTMYDRNMYVTIAYIGNMILAELKNLKADNSSCEELK